MAHQPTRREAIVKSLAERETRDDTTTMAIAERRKNVSRTVTAASSESASQSRPPDVPEASGIALRRHLKAMLVAR